jgi:hypothetical protein
VSQNELSARIKDVIENEPVARSRRCARRARR